MDVFGKPTISTNSNFALVNASEKEISLYDLKKGDVLFIRSSVKKSGVGETSVLLKDLNETVYSGFLIRFRDNKIPLELNFKRYCFNVKRFRENLISLSSTSANTNINQDSLNSLTLSVPSTKEQEQISNFLTLIDERISAQIKIIQRFESLMRGTADLLLKQKVRFKSKGIIPYQNWTEKKGNEVFDNISTKNHNSDLPILAITQEYGAVPRDLIEYQISVSEKSIESYKVVEKGDFIISLRSFQGGIEYSYYKGICSPAYTILRASIKIDERFFKYYFKTDFYIQRLNEKLEGIRDGKMISYKYFSDIKLFFPELDEQVRISDFLSSIDQKIETEKKILAQYENQKKYLLQNLFI
jgi:type I restriction enzyme S subunit